MRSPWSYLRYRGATKGGLGRLDRCWRMNGEAGFASSPGMLGSGELSLARILRRDRH